MQKPNSKNQEKSAWAKMAECIHVPNKDQKYQKKIRRKRSEVYPDKDCRSPSRHRTKRNRYIERNKKKTKVDVYQPGTYTAKHRSRLHRSRSSTPRRHRSKTPRNTVKRISRNEYRTSTKSENKRYRGRSIKRRQSHRTYSRESSRSRQRTPTRSKHRPFITTGPLPKSNIIMEKKDRHPSNDENKSNPEDPIPGP